MYSGLYKYNLQMYAHLLLRFNLCHRCVMHWNVCGLGFCLFILSSELRMTSMPAATLRDRGLRLQRGNSRSRVPSNNTTQASETCVLCAEGQEGIHARMKRVSHGYLSELAKGEAKQIHASIDIFPSLPRLSMSSSLATEIRMSVRGRTVVGINRTIDIRTDCTITGLDLIHSFQVYDNIDSESLVGTASIPIFYDGCDGYSD